MATSSLTNMTVPLGADGQSPSTQGLLMPKLAFRFRVFFTNFGVSTPTTELSKQVMKFDRPHVQFEEIKLPIYNSTVKITGKHSWNDVTCDLRDDAQGNVSQLVGEQLQKQLDFMEQSSASSGIDYKFTTVFQVLDGGNGANQPLVLEEWNILGCYLKDVNYNSMDYGTSEAVKISMTITFDNAIQVNTAGTPIGVGEAIRRTTNSVATGTGAFNPGGITITLG
jgi:hypothetical protein